MKKWMLLCLTALLLGLTACAGEHPSSFRVGVFYFAYSDPFVSSIRTELDRQLQAAEIDYTNYDADNSQATQNAQIQTALSDGCDLLVVNLVTAGVSDAARVVLDLAGDVPVLFFNRAVEEVGREDLLLGSCDTAGLIGADPHQAGHLQGEMIGRYLLEHYDTVDRNGDGVISYALLKGSEADAEAVSRSRYAVEDANALLQGAGYPALAYFDADSAVPYQVDLSGSWSAQAALDYMTTNLSQYNTDNGNMIELVICNNDAMAEGSVRALQAAGYNDGTGCTVPVFGVDATVTAQRLIAAGQMAGTVRQDAAAIARAAAETAAAVRAGSALPAALAAVAQSEDGYSLVGAGRNRLLTAYTPYP